MHRDLRLHLRLQRAVLGRLLERPATRPPTSWSAIVTDDALRVGGARPVPRRRSRRGWAASARAPSRRSTSACYTDDDPENVRREPPAALCRGSASTRRRRRWPGSTTAPTSCEADGRGHRHARDSSSSAATGSGRASPAGPLMLVTADCLPVALARANGTPAVAVLHAGWRGLLAGIVEAGVAALGGGPCRARRSARGSGRAATRSATRSPRRSASASATRSSRGRNLDLHEAAERALRAAGLRRGRARRALHLLRGGALLLPPPRPGPHRPPGDRCRYRLSVVRENYARIRDEVGPGVTVVAATKYVTADELGVLAEAGVEVVGENRLQDLDGEARALRRRVPLALHRPPPVAQGAATSRSSASSATRSELAPRRGG